MTEKILTIILFLSLVNITYAQKCEKNIDPFTSEESVSFNFNNKTVYYELKKEDIIFEITFHYPGERNYKFKEGTKFLIKLKDGDKIELNAKSISSPKIEQYSFSNGTFYPTLGGMTTTTTANFTAYSFSFELTIEQLNKFANSLIEIIRVPDTDEGKFNDVESKGRSKKKFKAVNRGAKCIRENFK